MFEHIDIGYVSLWILIFLLFGVPLWIRAYYLNDAIRKMTKRRDK